MEELYNLMEDVLQELYDIDFDTDHDYTEVAAIADKLEDLRQESGALA